MCAIDAGGRFYSVLKVFLVSIFRFSRDNAGRIRFEIVRTVTKWIDIIVSKNVT